MPKLAGINHLRAVAVLERAGFKIYSSERAYRHVRRHSYRYHPRHDPVNAITMGGIVRDASFLTIEQFRKLL